MLLLRNQVQPYAWGAIDGLARIVGSAPTGGPEAELWVGTHPGAPSLVVGDPEARTLAQVIAADPARWLGPELAAEGHTALPFLLKVLAIGRPLSLQAHPSQAQAEAGFEREDAAGLALDAPDRSYRDVWPKPEALVALGTTWALCGFRPPLEAANLLAGLGVEAFDPLVSALATGDEAHLRTVLGWLLRLDGRSRDAIAAAVAASVERLRGDDLADPRVWVRRLVDAFPGDPTAVAPLLLNVVRLDADEAVHLPAGNLHAYLDGAGVEIMAASDNVLRGGLTPKHIDVDELLAVLQFEPGMPPSPVIEDLGGGVTTYDAGEEAFALAALTPGDATLEIAPVAPSLLLATGGSVEIDGPGATGALVVAGGDAVFVPPGSGSYRVAGTGRVWWGTTGDGLPA
ncbi:mannose-6-phosphate isomerase, class I [Aquihabitans sp. McL0605]|uniref:mannose-6-phosphate isomerase, class I n=1 Tax=Aquihabitans sp. McL0605 TaxID=3415671 RepID=UPI003CFB1686